MTLLETLRALAPVVTPGPQHFPSMLNPCLSAADRVLASYRAGEVGK